MASKKKGKKGPAKLKDLRSSKLSARKAENVKGGRMKQDPPIG